MVTKAYYKHNESSGGATDYSGNSKTLALTGSISGQVGKIWGARGAFPTENNNYLSNGSVFTVGKTIAFTMMCLMKFPSTPWGNESVMSAWWPSNSDIRADMGIDWSSHISFSCGKNHVSGYAAVAAATFVTGKRYKTAWVYDWADGMSLYVDYAPPTTQTFGATGVVDDDDLMFGGVLYDGGWGYKTSSAANIYVDEWRLESAALWRQFIKTMFSFYDWMF